MDDRLRALKSDIQAELAAIARLFEVLPGEGADLSAEGLAGTLEQAHRLRAMYAEDIRGFMAFLDRLAEPGPDSQHC
jgi:hypothetical protein